jgi:hypothetical protein
MGQVNVKVDEMKGLQLDFLICLIRGDSSETI